MEQRPAEDLLQLLTQTDFSSRNSLPKERSGLNGVFRGMISEFDQASGVIHIVLPSLSLVDPLEARSIVPIEEADVGKEALVSFEAGNPRHPCILGLLWKHGRNGPTQVSPVEAKVDGEQVVIEGKKEIVLKCGKASITLTRAGKVLIRGAYVLSRSSGVNRIKGGSVQVN